MVDVYTMHIYEMLESVLDKYTKKEERKPNEISVTEVVGCLRKAYYERIYKIERVGLSAFRGIAMHKVILEAFVEKFNGEMEYEVRKEFNNITLRGTIDYINKDKDFIIEIKTSNYDRIHSRWIYQVLTYLYLANISKAFILLITNDKAYVAEINRSEDIIDIILPRAEELHNSIVNNRPPVSTTINPKDFECAYCPFITNCRNDIQTTLDFDDKI